MTPEERKELKRILAENEKLRQTKDLYERLDNRYAGLARSYHKLKKENEKLHEELAYYQQHSAAPGEPPSPVVEEPTWKKLGFSSMQSYESSLPHDLTDRLAKLEHRLRDGTNWEKVEFRLQAVEAMAVKLDTTPPAKQPEWYEELIDRINRLVELVAKDWDEIQELKAMLVPEEPRKEAK